MLKSESYTQTLTARQKGNAGCKPAMPLAVQPLPFAERCEETSGNLKQAMLFGEDSFCEP